MYVMVAGRLCSFSPCIEQVQQTCIQLKEQGFTGLTGLVAVCPEHRHDRHTNHGVSIEELRLKPREFPHSRLGFLGTIPAVKQQFSVSGSGGAREPGNWQEEAA